VTDPVSRYEFEDLERRVGANETRLDDIDRNGTRGVAVLAVQVQALTESIGGIKADFVKHEERHMQDQQAARSDRKWAIGIILAMMAAIGGLYPFMSAVMHR